MPRGSKNLFYDIVDAMDVCESPRNNQEYAIALMDETLASQGIDMHSALRESVSADDVLQEQKKAFSGAYDATQRLENLM